MNRSLSRHAIVFMLFCMYICFGYAQENQPSEFVSPEVAVRDCIANFDIETANLHSLAANQYLYLLIDFFLCRAAALDSPDQCRKLKERESCIHNFNSLWAYYGRLMFEGRITPRIIAVCKNNLGDGAPAIANACQVQSRAILEGDPSLWKEVRDPRLKNLLIAYGTLNEQACPDNECRQLVKYLKALKTGDERQCRRIRNSNMMWLCLGGVKLDTKICEQNPGYRKFIKLYCTDKIKGREAQ